MTKRTICRSLLLCLFVSLFLATPAFAEFASLPNAAKSNLPAIKRYPKASSVLLWVSDAYQLNDDGTQVYEHHEFRYLPDEAARDLWGDPHLAYVEGRQKIDVIAARAYTSDGRTIDATPENAYNPITPEGLDHAPDFAEFRQLVVTLLGLENGSVAELHYRLTTDKPAYRWLWGRTYFREESPTISRELSVELPAGYELNFQCYNGAPDPKIEGTKYSWHVGEQPGYLAEDLRGHRVLLSNVAFTTARDWNDVVGELRARVKNASDHPALPRSLEQMLSGATSIESRLDTIRSWVRERFNEVEFDHPDFMTSLRPASKTLESGYGNSLELAVLISDLCNTAGVTASPEVWFAFDPPVPYLYDLSGGLVSASTECGQIEVDPIEPAEEFGRTSLADATVLAFGADNTPQKRLPADMDFGKLGVRLNLNALEGDTLHGAGTLTANTLRTPYEALRSDPKGCLEHLISWNGFAVEDLTVRQLGTDMCVVSFTFSLAGADTVGGNHVLSANVMNLSQFAGNPAFNFERREFPHWVKLPGTVSVHWEAPLPDGWTVSQQPSSVSRAWKEGSGTRSVQVKSNRIVVDEELIFGSAWILPNDWAEFRSFLIETSERPSNVVVFAHKPN